MLRLVSIRLLHDNVEELASNNYSPTWTSSSNQVKFYYAKSLSSFFFFFFSSRRRHTRSLCDWSSDVCSSDLLCGHHGLADQGGVVGRGVAVLGQQVVLEAHARMAAKRGGCRDAGVFRGAEGAHGPGLAAVMRRKKGQQVLGPREIGRAHV